MYRIQSIVQRLRLTIKKGKAYRPPYKGHMTPTAWGVCMQQLLLAKMTTVPALRCEVAAELARCQGLLGEHHLQRATLEGALGLCAICKPASDTR